MYIAYIDTNVELKTAIEGEKGKKLITFYVINITLLILKKLIFIKKLNDCLLIYYVNIDIYNSLNGYY